MLNHCMFIVIDIDFYIRILSRIRSKKLRRCKTDSLGVFIQVTLSSMLSENGILPILQHPCMDVMQAFLHSPTLINTMHQRCIIINWSHPKTSLPSSWPGCSWGNLYWTLQCPIAFAYCVYTRIKVENCCIKDGHCKIKVGAYAPL